MLIILSLCFQTKTKKPHPLDIKGEVRWISLETSAIEHSVAVEKGARDVLVQPSNPSNVVVVGLQRVQVVDQVTASVTNLTGVSVVCVCVCVCVCVFIYVLSDTFLPKQYVHLFFCVFFFWRSSMIRRLLLVSEWSTLAIVTISSLRGR